MAKAKKNVVMDVMDDPALAKWREWMENRPDVEKAHDKWAEATGRTGDLSLSYKFYYQSVATFKAGSDWERSRRG